MSKNLLVPSPLVSVIMPAYNVEPYLDQAITSILNQTYTNFELIAVNDGSSDGSKQILDKYAALDSRIVVIHQENKGVVSASNRAIELSKGKYIARQDSDDISFPKRLAQQVAILESYPDIELVTGSFEGFDEDDEFIYREVLPAEDEDIKRAMYLRNPIGHGSTMFRRKTIIEVGAYGANGDTRGLAEDYELFLRLTKKGRFIALEASMYHWRINRKGLTSTQNKLMAAIMKDHINDIWRTGCPRIIGTNELRGKCNQYKKRGVGMKKVLLSDNAQMGVKMIRHGYPIKGIRQLFSVLFIGRSGVAAVWARFRHIRKGTAMAIRRKMWLSN